MVFTESGERKRNLTTLVLVRNAAVKQSRSRQKVSESSQNPLSSNRTFRVARARCSEAKRPRYTRYSVKTTLERCGPFSLVVLSQRRSHVTSLSGHSDQNASETFSNKLQLNKVQSLQLKLLKFGAKLKQAKESKLTLHAVVIFRLKQTKQRNTE